MICPILCTGFLRRVVITVVVEASGVFGTAGSIVCVRDKSAAPELLGPILTSLLTD
jgi:hypothetical protein